MKRIRLGALIAPSSSIQRSSPVLVTAGIPRKSLRDFAAPSLARPCEGHTTGVRPRGAKLRPRTSSERKPVSSPQKMAPFSRPARAAMAGYSWLSQRCTAWGNTKPR